jgi:S-adenosyl-L-methionine hydrolase (adenosine-forming)
MSIITLLTDFGVNDPFVGVLHAVLHRECPSARVIDVTHAIPPQAVASAGFWLARVQPWFPAGTVHLAVVDPGVGTNRQAVVAEVDGHVYVGPHNGLFDSLFARASEVRLHLIDPTVPLASNTFHARDLFAPIAGRLASGALTPNQVGPCLPRPPNAPITQRRAGAGKVLWIDRFGNLITDIEEHELAAPCQGQVMVGGRAIQLGRTYADVAVGSLVALFGGFGTLEIAVRDGSAHQHLSLGVGTPVRVVSSVGR